MISHNLRELFSEYHANTLHPVTYVCFVLQIYIHHIHFARAENKRIDVLVYNLLLCTLDHNH